MGERWSKEKAWEWHNSHPWLRGCNFMSSDCANRIDQWQELGFEERLKTADAELELAAKTGFNTIRIILEFIVWDKDHNGFMERFERYISTAAKHGISCTVVFGNDCMPPKSPAWRPLELGPQHYDWGYHGGKKASQHAVFSDVGYHLLDEPELAERHYEWVREIIEKYKSDERIIMWDMYNEPGNSNRTALTPKHIQKFFQIARSIDPIQPLTAATWTCSPDRNQPIRELEQWCIDNSDVISYHNYGSYNDNIQIIKRLKEFDRPIINTEWLGRIFKNTVEEMFPLFYLEEIGCYNWGFVAGLYQTYEPWEGTWTNYYNGTMTDIDFTKWFHDLYRPNHRPYDPKEIEIIKHFSSLADEEFANTNK